MGRVIALVDMNSFYASCHQAVNPELAGKEDDIYQTACRLLHRHWDQFMAGQTSGYYLRQLKNERLRAV